MKAQQDLWKRAQDLSTRIAKDLTAGREYKPLFTGDKIRVSWRDHPGNVLLIEELPGKPVKRRVRRFEFDTGWYVQGVRDGGGSKFLMVNILRDAKLNKGMSYDSAVSAMRKAVEMAKEGAMSKEYDEAWFKKTGWPRTVEMEDDVSYLQVEPHDYAPIKIKGKDFGGTSEWNNFKFYAERDEDEDMAYNEGMSAFYKSKSAGGARKLFKLLKANPDAVKGMGIDQFTGWLAKNKIAYDYVPTVWR